MSARPDTSNFFETIMQQAMKGQSKEWWNSYHYPETVKFNPEDLIGCARSALYIKAVQGGTLYEIRVERFIDFSKEISNLSEYLFKNINARLVYNKINHTKRNMLFYIFNDGAISVSYNNELVTFDIISLDQSKVKLIEKIAYNINYE